MVVQRRLQMKLGILSDTHNNVAATQAALQLFRTRGVERLIHCGDLTKPRMVRLFEGWQAAFVFGNIDRKQDALTRVVEQTEGPYYIGPFYEVELARVRIGACHGHVHDTLQGMIESGRYDLALHGHTHRQRDERLNDTRIINPGALGGTYYQPRSACILDLNTMKAEFCHV